MGIKIKDIVEPKKISISDLSGKSLAVDSFNILYQFLTTIRQPDGTPLMDKNNMITSHLVGLFSRTTKLMMNNIKLAFVFDGKTPELKSKEQKRRKQAKEEAQEKYKIAMEKQDIEAMKKYASRTTVLTKEIIDEAKILIRALGMPIIQAPSEGEAQAAYMAKKNDIFGTVSQDGDSLIFGAPRFVRNLSLTQRKKSQNKLSYEKTSPEIISLNDTLNSMQINIDQLIIYAILVGTDYNSGGVKGIGPKTAIKLVKEYRDRYDELFKEVCWDEYFDYPWSNVYDVIKKMPATDDYELKWNSPDTKAIKELLVEKHDFSEERVDSVLEELKTKMDTRQKGLGDFF
ncbi:MAG: flap endonuclease-1 [Candidatus Woesearchaeota archaeon]